MSTTGLLLLTNDGEFAQKVAHPSFGVEKTYIVTVRGFPDAATLTRARAGIRVEGQKLRVKSVDMLRRLTSRPRPKGRTLTPGLPRRSFSEGGRGEGVEKARLRVVLVEGKNREVRRLFQALGHRVLDLHRSKVGSLTDRGLAIGSFRSLTAREVRSLSSPSRRK
jgi:23S rRNA pseudouridine2605 synthase